MTLGAPALLVLEGVPPRIPGLAPPFEEATHRPMMEAAHPAPPGLIPMGHLPDGKTSFVGCDGWSQPKGHGLTRLRRGVIAYEGEDLLHERLFKGSGSWRPLTKMCTEKTTCPMTTPVKCVVFWEEIMESCLRELEGSSFRGSCRWQFQLACRDGSMRRK